MIHAPHPALRRLFALGSAPGQALSALEVGRAALDALSGELDSVPLLSDAAVAALAAALDLSPLDAALEGRPLPPHAPEGTRLSGEAVRRTGEGLTRVTDQPWPRAAFPVSAPKRGAGSVGAAAAPASLARVEALLARHAPEAGGQPFQDVSGGPPGRAPSGALPGTSPHGAGGGASGALWEGAAAPEHGADRRPARPRPRTDSEPRLRASAPSVEEAAEVLARRAARAGSPEAATTRVGATPAPADVERLLADGVSRDRATEIASPPPSHLGRLADAVARLERRAPLVAGASAPPAAVWPAGSGPKTAREPHRAAAPAPAPDREVPRESPSGLRGLLRRVGPPDAEDGTPAWRPAPPREPFPDLLAERMEDSLLADRLAAVLRREAMCQGIDLERAD